MPAIYLQIDHRNMRQLLRILEEDIDAYNAGRPGDFELMKQILEYTLHYPNLIHHPREEMLFRRLIERDPASKGLVSDLTKNHEQLARLTHRFAAALHNVSHDVELPRALFAKVADEYLTRSRAHMDTEEHWFFRACSRSFATRTGMISTFWPRADTIRCSGRPSKATTRPCIREF